MPKKPPRPPEFDEIVRTFDEVGLDLDQMDLDEMDLDEMDFDGEDDQDFFMPFEYDTPLIGRRQELAALGKMVSDPNRGPDQPVVLCGAEGVGKTRLAAEVVVAYGVDFDGVFWVDCSYDRGILDQIARCLDTPLDPMVNGPVPELAKMIRQSWDQMGRVLVVFDHLNDESVYEDWYPQNGVSLVIVSDEPPDFDHDLFTLGSPSREDSVALMTSRLKSMTSKNAESLVQALGHDPQTLILAASFLAQAKSKLSVDTYLKRLMAQPLDKKQFPKGLDSDAEDGGREARLTAAFMVALQQIKNNKKHNTMAMNLLGAMFHLAHGVDVDWYAYFGQDLGGTIRYLIKLGILEPMGEGRVLLRKGLWRTMPYVVGSDFLEKTNVKIGERALHLVSALNDEYDFYSFRDHVQHLVRLIEALFGDEHLELACDLARELIRYYTMTQNQSEAKDWYFKVSKYFARIDPDHELALPWRFKASSYDVETGDFEDAAQDLAVLYRDVVKRYGKTSLLAGLVLCKQGVAAKHLGQVEKALQLLTRGLDDMEQGVEGDGGFRLEFLLHLAECHHLSGDAEPALACLNEMQGLLKAKSHLGDDAVIECLVRVADLLNDMGQIEKARDIMVEVIGRQGELYGYTAPELMGSRIFLSDILQRLGEDDMALSMLQAVYDTATEHFPEDDPLVISVTSRLGKLLTAMEDYDEARRLLEYALAQVPRGRLDDVLAVLRSNLGQLYLALEQPQKAIVHMKQALEVGKAVYPPNHPELSTHLFNLGSAYLELGEAEKARKLLVEALKLDQMLYDANHPSLLAQRMGLSRALFELGRLEEARIHLTAIVEASTGDEEIVCHAYEALAYVDMKAGHVREALGHAERARELAGTFLDGDHEMIATLDAFIDQVRAQSAPSGQSGNPAKKAKSKAKKKAKPSGGKPQNGGVVIPFPGGKKR